MSFQKKSAFENLEKTQTGGEKTKIIIDNCVPTKYNVFVLTKHEEVMSMKKTKYKALTSYSMSNVTYKRVYVDDNGKRFIKTKDGYKCIEGTECVNNMIED